MSAAFKFREVPPDPPPRGTPGRARVLPLSPAHISARPSGDGQHAEKVMGTYTRTFCVNAQKTAVKSELGVWARSEPAKILSLRTGISQSRIYDWRSERFGANAATMEIVRRDRLDHARAQIEQAKAVIRQSLGELAELYPDAVEQILRAK